MGIMRAVMIRLFGLVSTAFLALLLMGSPGGAPLANPNVCGTNLAPPAPKDEPLRRFAQSVGIEHIDAFVNLVNYVDANASLPDCYLTKAHARKVGWFPGGRLWDSAPGMSIGGDRFGNRERRLPPRFNGRYLEADLDYGGRERGPKRLVFVPSQPGSGLIWVTTDHYRTFQKVPQP